MMQTVKEIFIFSEAINYFKTMKGDEVAKWGLMNPQQMIEHLSDSVRMGNGVGQYSLITPEENLPRMKAFMLSDKDFKPNTPNSLMGDTPPAVRNTDMALAIKELQHELQTFYNHYLNREMHKETNPFFGNLNYHEWVQLFYKHFRHHLRQFGLLEHTV